MKNLDFWQVEREDFKNDFYTDKNGKIQVIVRKENTDSNRPMVTIWLGNKSKNPKYRYCFNNESARVDFITRVVTKYINSCNLKIDKRIEDKNLRKTYKPQVKIGDIFHSCFGYNMILNEFYKVIDIKGKKITLQELQKEYENTGCFMQYHVKPTDKLIGKTFTKMLQVKFINGKAHEYISLPYDKHAKNVTEEIKTGRTWLQDEAD